MTQHYPRHPSSVTCCRNRPANKAFNHTTGQRVGPGFFPRGDRPKAKTLASRINGDFTGTTQDILRWAACKWGIDQDIVFAEAAVESWWRQRTLGDWGTNARLCPPGHGLGVDGKPGKCPQSYGILQNSYPFEKRGWPGIVRSTAMNADAAYAIWRSCYDGYETWLNGGPSGQRDRAGLRGTLVCRKLAQPGCQRAYIGKVKRYMRERIRQRPGFNQVG